MSGKFLGVGWKFPIEVDKTTGRIKTSSQEEDIKEAIGLILNTRKGERIMRLDFGSRIHDYVFEDMRETTIHLMKNEIQQAILDWEPRVKNIKVQIEEDSEVPSKLNVDISYVVRTTNNLFNMVYPFYINEGVQTD